MKTNPSSTWNRRAVLMTMGALSAALLAAPAWAQVLVVRFLQPQRYTDAAGPGGYGDVPSPDVLRGLETQLREMGRRNLTPGQTLRVDILDVDLAGRYEPWQPAAQRVRILTDITWPRIRLRYTLEQDGQVVRAGEESVADINYLGRTSAISPSEPLRYEKAMLEDWMRSLVGDAGADATGSARPRTDQGTRQ